MRVKVSYFSRNWNLQRDFSRDNHGHGGHEHGVCWGVFGVSFHLKRCPQGVASVLCKKTPILASRRSMLDHLTVHFTTFVSKVYMIASASAFVHFLLLLAIILCSQLQHRSPFVSWFPFQKNSIDIYLKAFVHFRQHLVCVPDFASSFRDPRFSRRCTRQQMSQKVVLVTGGAGFNGGSTASCPCSKQATTSLRSTTLPTASPRKRSPLLSNVSYRQYKTVAFYHADLLNPSSLEEVFGKVSDWAWNFFKWIEFSKFQKSKFIC